MQGKAAGIVKFFNFPCHCVALPASQFKISFNVSCQFHTLAGENPVDFGQVD